MAITNDHVDFAVRQALQDHLTKSHGQMFYVGDMNSRDELEKLHDTIHESLDKAHKRRGIAG